MFSWNFAKSAEELLSRYAVKRICKFILKKKLGNIIHGDIDLDQLDVQLSSGLIVLTDLALNVDFLNHKLEQVSMFKVKEGSIRSLVVRMPWNGEGCEVEMDELELVVFPCCDGNSNEVGRSHDSNEDYCANHDLGKGEHDTIYKSAAVSVNIHEGVKTVAKMVKWLLTSFCIRIKRVIVAFDISPEEKGKEGPHDALVLRVAELECEACISEGCSSTDDANDEDFLGISHLTSSLKFKGVVIEHLHMNSVDNETCSTPQVAAFSCFLPNASRPLLTGEKGGFCGTVKLSIPWKNGSLDTCKVDAEVNVDTLIAKLQPSTLKWILVTWELLENYEKIRVDNVTHLSADSNLHASASLASSSCMMADKGPPPDRESFDLKMPMREEFISDLLLKESCFISDWVPYSAGNCKNVAIEEANLGASVDQYFECFDELRSSQFILGSSGMWNLTCSVFSAITAASNLASESLNASTEQQHLETNLKMNFLGFSTIISFSDSDEDQLNQHKPADEQIDPSFDVRYLCLSLHDIFIDVQVYPHEWKSKATVKHIVLDDYFCQKGGSLDFSLHGNEKGFSGQTIMIRALQEKVLGVLPSSCMFSEPARLDVSEIRSASLNLLGTQKSASDSNLVKATLFETSNTSHCVCAVSSRCFDGLSSRRTSFSLNLPPVILWLNFDLVNVALEFSRNLVSSSRMDKSGVSEIIGKEHTSLPNITSKPGKGSLRGSVFLPHARIVLCFPLKLGAGFRSYLSCDQFIALDLFSPSNFEKLKGEGYTTVLEDNCWKKYSPSPSHSVHLNIVNLDVYHITRVVPDDSSRSTQLESHKFSSHKILSLGNGSCWVVLVSMLWHEDAVTGAWVMKSAKNLATSEGPASKRSASTSDFEFASVSTREDKRVSSLPKQKELILSSKFCLHVGLPIMVVTLRRSQYLCFFNLLSQVIDALGSVGSDMAYENRGTIVAQSSVILECGLAEIHIELDLEDCPKSSLQIELPGSWSRLRLEINNFQLLSVSDVGAISGARFLWISHDEGNLWGSITSVADQDLLLISCCNSSNGRGDGKSSNVLSCRHAGFDFAHVSDLESFHNYMSIVLKCITIVAPGGRLDWLDKIISFFSLPSPDAVQEVDCNRQKGVSERLSFVVSFVDGALSYEPYFCDLGVTGQCITPKSSISANLDECESCIACLLSASSLTLSSTMVAGILENYYNIRLRDVGLLLHEASDKEKIVGDYSANYLRELGYVKVAGEALVDAVLRINFENVIFWELNCSRSHVILSTCHDTTLGLMRLASQIQQLFAPDMEESLVHLQNRWNSLKQVHGEDDGKEVSETSSNSSPRTFQVQQLGTDSMVESRLVSLMDEISEDAFLFHGNSMSSFGKLSTSEESDRGLYHEGHSFVYPCSEKSVQDGHSTILPSSEIVEGCSLSGLRSLSELTINSHFPESNSLSRSESRGNVAVQRVNSGWYESTSLSILENYVPDQSGQLNSKQVLGGQQNYEEDNGSHKFKGRVLLNNIDVKWRLYAGSDWHDLGEVVEHPEKNYGRDETVCLELALSDVNIRYDIFPDGNLCVSRLCLSIQDVDLFDKSENAPWIQVLGYYSSKEWPRQSFSKSIKLDLEAVRPDPMTPLEEYRLRIAVLPILLHLHQTQLDFLISFFGGKGRPDDQSQDNMKDSVSSDVTLEKDNKSKDLADEALLPFFQKFDIWPIIVRVDYCPSRVDLAALSGGKYVELVNLVHWKGVELHLKHVQAAGVYGWKNVCEITIGEWLEDISQNQIHKLLQGLTAIRSFVAVGSGAAKLVCLPVKNYRKDHRLVKGLQRGTVAFLRSISIEALGLGVHLAAGAHEILLHAECILRRIQPSLPNPIKHKLKTNRGSDQPEDAQHGLRQAYESLNDGLGKTASALIHTPMKTYQRGGGAGSALVTAVRGAPAAAIAPASAAAQALRCALLGVKNSLDREHKENL